jgi:hypothetical protein
MSQLRPILYPLIPGVAARPVSNLVSIGGSGPVWSRTPPALRPPRPRTDRPAGHGRADASLERNARLLVGLVVDLSVGALRLTDSMPSIALALLS